MLFVISSLICIVRNLVTKSSKLVYYSRTFILDYLTSRILIVIVNFVGKIITLGIVEGDYVAPSTDGDSFLSRINFVVTVNIDCLLGYLSTKGLTVYSLCCMKDSVIGIVCIVVSFKVVNRVRNIPHNNQDV